MLKEIATGTSDFKKLIESNSYYVDKTKIIEDILRSTKDVYLFPRPRRFGKSLFITMMDNFLNIEYAGKNDSLFKGIYILKV